MSNQEIKRFANVGGWLLFAGLLVGGGIMILGAVSVGRLDRSEGWVGWSFTGAVRRATN